MKLPFAPGLLKSFISLSLQLNSLKKHPFQKL